MCNVCVCVCVCVVINSCSVSPPAPLPNLNLLRDGGHRGDGALAGGTGRSGRTRRRLAGPLGFLLLDSLLDQVVGHVDGIRAAGNRDDPVTRTGRKYALLADLDVCPREVLDLDQAAAGGTWVNNKKQPDSVSLDQSRANNSPF